VTFFRVSFVFYGDRASGSQLVWFENPGMKEITPSWRVHIIHEGTEDISIRIHNMKLPDGTVTPVVFSAGFWRLEITLLFQLFNQGTMDFY